MFFFFFFPAEDGIRDRTVTGVQTCALPISPAWLPCTTRSCGKAPRPRPERRLGRPARPVSAGQARPARHVERTSAPARGLPTSWAPNRIAVESTPAQGDPGEACYTVPTGGRGVDR